MKVNSIYQSKGHRELKRCLEAYYNLASPEYIDKIKIDIFHPLKNLRQRKESYLEHKQLIEQLKPLFKNIKKAHIQIAKDQGFNTYLEFLIATKGFSVEKLDFFFKKVDLVIRSIVNDLPIPGHVPSWYWSEFNIPDALYFFKKDFELKVPRNLFDMIEKILPEFKPYKERIRIGEISDFVPVAKYISADKTVTIEVPHKASLYNALTFLHELGHAITMLRLSDIGVNPYSKSKYWHEEKAFKFKFDTVKKIFPNDVILASRGEALDDFVSTFFEYDIYNNIGQDFDKAYARANNRCFPGLSYQKVNPFYILENGFIIRPFSTLVASIVQTELLLNHESSYEFS